MDVADQIYVNIIWELFGIKLESKREIDLFYKIIEKRLDDKQIELLQIRTHEAFCNIHKNL